MLDSASCGDLDLKSSQPTLQDFIGLRNMLCPGGIPPSRMTKSSQTLPLLIVLLLPLTLLAVTTLQKPKSLQRI